MAVYFFDLQINVDLAFGFNVGVTFPDAAGGSVAANLADFTHNDVE